MNRLQRILTLLGGSVFMYLFLMQPFVLSFLIPQIQVFMVGLLVATISALVGSVVGMVLFPAKVDWSCTKHFYSPATVARVIIVLSFMYYGISYA